MTVPGVRRTIPRMFEDSVAHLYTPEGKNSRNPLTREVIMNCCINF